MSKRLKVAELFAGVGGFRIGLERTKKFEIVWSNQWEPSTKAQHASWVYEERFKSGKHSNENIEEVPTDDIEDHDLLCGGFPCQDYSVATTLKNSKGLRGKKGVLWWSIERILREKEGKRPKYLFLENVDRLIKSPATQRGRDFAIMLKSLNDLGYAVEWRVINAADYGMPQRRRRVFILGYHLSTPIYKQIKRSPENWLHSEGVLSSAFQCKLEFVPKEDIDPNLDLTEITDNFNKGGKLSPFENTGLFIDNAVHTFKTKAQYDGPRVTLKDILEPLEKVPEEFFISDEELDKWNYLKGAKKEIRRSANGHEYHYSEGGMIFPDSLDSPSRTIITGEGGKSPSRFKHVVNQSGQLRRLTPIELERLNMFPDNHTHLDGLSATKRAFFMGNALVVGIIEKIGLELSNRISQ